MVVEPKRGGAGRRDEVQNVGVPGMPGARVGVVQDASGSRRISVGSVRVHYTHVQNGRELDEKCGACAAGLARMVEDSEKAARAELELEVAESSRGDEKGSAAFARSGRTGRGEA